MAFTSGGIASTAQASLDPVSVGPHEVASAEYRFAAATDPDVLSIRATEIWARVFFPKALDQGPFPLIAFLHGNHLTCGRGENPRRDDSNQYTYTGTCPAGSTVTPNHEGYNYAAEHLASHGYVVFSINANRGITAGNGTPSDYGLNLARGRLFLKHFQLWKRWSTEGGAPESLGVGPQGFIGRIDFNHVGLMGHSRGGEGARAALKLYTDPRSPWINRIPGMKIGAIFEIGAVDGQTDEVLDAPGVVWNQLIPTCDGDVSDFQGINPYNRMLRSEREPLKAQKSVTLVYGANHNYFNSEWQSSDSKDCTHHKPIFSAEKSTSEEQQTVAKILMSHFFLANLGTKSDRRLNEIFNPLQPVPTALASITSIEKELAISPNSAAQVKLDDFLPTQYDDGYESEPLALREAGPGVALEMGKAFDGTAPYMNVSWEETLQAQSVKPELKISWKEGRDLSLAKTLDLRFSLDPHEIRPSDLDFQVSLVDTTGARSLEVKLSEVLRHPKLFNPGPTYLFETARFPVNLFRGVSLERIRGVHFRFDGASAGRVTLANLRFTNFFASADVEKAGAYEQDQRQQGIQREWGVSLPSLSLAWNSLRNGRLARLSSGAADSQATVPSRRVVQVIGRSRSRVVELREAPFAAYEYGASGRSRYAELVLESDAKFPVRDALPVLRIGDREFKLSAIDAASGRITFGIPSLNREKIRGKTLPVRVYYKGDSARYWDFGSLTF